MISVHVSSQIKLYDGLLTYREVLIATLNRESVIYAERTR